MTLPARPAAVELWNALEPPNVHPGVDDETITAHITDLTAELDALGPGDGGQAAELQDQREQSRDLLRQRELRRRSGEDPGLAEVDTELNADPDVEVGNGG